MQENGRQNTTRNVFTCTHQDCNKVFPTKSKLIRHSKVHQGNLKYLWLHIKSYAMYASMALKNVL